VRLLTVSRALGQREAILEAGVFHDMDDLKRSHSTVSALCTIVERWMKADMDDDVQRWRDREALVEFARVEPAHAEIAVATLLEMYRGAGDWGGLLEAARQLQLRTAYRWTMADHLELGEAYWRQATELELWRAQQTSQHDGTLSDWLVERAVSHFVQGGCLEHLAELSRPTVRTGETHDASPASRQPAHA
jgi:hypothetical protein